ncbi:MAG: GNAT family N-acetyltransferase [candidate division Zixibacteria bacterium]|nr:GNAT family N-acetyltransferase [candidate division Zixibacteria bacterium]
MITIRELQSGDDVNAVLRLCRYFFEEYTEHHEEFFDLDNLSDDDISGRFLESLESENSATIVALDDGNIVGYTSLVIREQPRFYKIKKVGAISALMVAKDHRRRGIGGALLTEAGDFFRRKGITYYTFYTAVANQGAIRLYEKLGIKPIHTAFLGKT